MIAVDWGTSSFRAYRLDPSGAVSEQRSAEAGLLASNGRFEEVLARQLAGWDDALIVMAGMVGSRNGWHEVPYVDAPAGVAEVAAGMKTVNALELPGRRVWIAPGVSSKRQADDHPEVMRGEEAQVLGLSERLPDDGPHTLCLPGTHSKWVTVQDARIVALRTAMTGELYALLRRHSLLAALMPAEGVDANDRDAFALGVTASARDGGLANHLFGVRAQGLFGMLTESQGPSYLSGLLIGHELRGLLPDNSPTVHLIGSEALTKRYEHALELLGIRSQCHDGALVAAGLFRLAKARGLSN